MKFIAAYGLDADADLYVRRSVANHIGDIAKDHPQLAFDLCERCWPMRRRNGNGSSAMPSGIRRNKG